MYQQIVFSNGSLFLKVSSLKEFKRLFIMVKVKDLCNFFKSQKSTDTPTLIASASDDVTLSEIITVEKEIKNSIQPRKYYNKNVPKKIKQKLEGTHLFTVLR